MYKAAQLTIGKLAALLKFVHFLYRFPTTVGWRESHVASLYNSQNYFKILIKDQQLATCIELHNKLQVNWQLCCSLYTCCTDFPYLWDGEKVMWNILIQTASLYTSQKYFKILINDQYVATCIELHSYLQVNWQLCCSLYTCCTDFPQLWDGEKVMWNILIHTASWYTSQKYFKILFEDQYVATCIELHSQLQVNFSSAAACTLAVHISHSCGMERKSYGTF